MHAFPCMCVGSIVWVRVHFGMCADQTWLFPLEKKAAHCPHAVLGLKSSLVWSETGPAWLELCVSAGLKPSLVPSCLFSWPTSGDTRDSKPPTQAQSDTSTTAPTQVTNLLTPSPGGYLLRGHRLRRVFCSALVWSAASA